MKRLLTVSVLALSLLFAYSVHAAGGNAENGQALSKKCGCHRKKIVLDGRSEDELVKDMMEYKAGNGSNKAMINIMKKYSDQDVLDLAAWYASQKK